MKTTIEIHSKEFEVRLNEPIADLSMSVGDLARAWYIAPPSFNPVILGDWKGAVELGGSVNFFNITFNPHAHGTHTETAGHITTARHSINKHFKDAWTLALVLLPKVEDGMVSYEAFLKSWQQAQDAQGTFGVKSVIIKTDCGTDNLQRNYSESNWPYLDAEIGGFLKAQGVDHLIIDQPSVDQEEDGGALACHRSFWGNAPEESLHRTITELAHVPDHIVAGNYLLNLQVAPLENDAAPSRPVLYALTPKL